MFNLRKLSKEIMVELCKNLYTSTLRSMIHDLLNQLEDLINAEHKFKGDKKKIKDLKTMLSIPMSVHIRYFQANRDEYCDIATKYDIPTNTSSKFLCAE